MSQQKAAIGGVGGGRQEVLSFTELRRRRKEKLEEAVKQMSNFKGVHGIMVTTEDWNVIQSTFHHNLTYYWKKNMKIVEHLATAATRDTDSGNELHFIRIQSKQFEILLSIANDHRVLVVFSGSGSAKGENRDPLKVCVQSVKNQKRVRMEMRKKGKGTRMLMDSCRPHTTIVGGKDKVIITERIGDKIMDQSDDVNNQS